MRQVILQSLTMTNFKGEKQRTTTFNAHNTTIKGANGTGKSRHFDAFLWLLFGKDKEDRKDYEIRTRVGGETLHKVECSVEATLLIDDTIVTLKRALTENWVKPRGQQEMVYKGDITECWWNNAPVKVGEYDRRVAEIIPADIFKMLTNPTFFCTMRWQQQREVLFQLAGTIDDAEIAAQMPEYQTLRTIIGNMGVKDFQAEHRATKNRLKKDLDGIQPRIDQVYKMMPQEEDYDGIERAIAAIDREVSTIDVAIASRIAATEQQQEQQQQRQQQINALRRECQQLVSDAQDQAQQEAYDANKARKEIERKVSEADKEVNNLRRTNTIAQEEITQRQGRLAQYHTLVEQLRQQWWQENEKAYDGDNHCPHCHQELPQDMQDQAQQLFTAAKHKALAAINSRGQETQKLISDEEQQIAHLNNVINSAQEEIAQLTADIAIWQQQLTEMPTVTAKEIDPRTIAAWVDKQEQITALRNIMMEEEKKEMPTTTQQTAQRTALLDDRATLAARLATQSTVERYQCEIAALEAQGRMLAQQIADIERDEYILQEFTRKKVEECERRINRLFTTVQFQLFDYTLDGNVQEVCVPLIMGVPYGAANTAARINAGLDIINTLCQHYGITAPIFVDNREAINRLTTTDSQVINLVVSTDKTLTIE